MSLGPGWRRAVRTESVEREVDEEIAFHLAMREEKLRAQGLAAEQARDEARTRFGDATRIREQCITSDRQYVRRMRFTEWFASVGADFRLGFRVLRKTP